MEAKSIATSGAQRYPADPSPASLETNDHCRRSIAMFNRCRDVTINGGVFNIVNNPTPHVEEDGQF
jgi:hypothetical protein